MSNSSSSRPARSAHRRSLLILAVVLLGAMLALYYRSFDPDEVIYSNDGPLGLISSQAVATSLGAFHGSWYDLEWLGRENVSASPKITSLLSIPLKPIGYAKFMVPIALVMLGLSAWLFFRQLKLAPLACVLGGLAAGLNSDFLSTASWGVVAIAVTGAMSYLALAALARVTAKNTRGRWARVVVAGLAVGMGVMEGYDVGALFSLFIAAFVLYQALFLNEGESEKGRKLVWGGVRLAVVAVAAGLISSHIVLSLIGTQIQGVAGMEQDERTRQLRWAQATEWSVPKAEILQAFVPGLFGYRQYWHMYENQQPVNDQYWGLVGANPNIDVAQKELSNPDPKTRAQVANFLRDPNLMWRLSGTGLYVGVLVAVAALWAALQSLRNKGSPFTLMQRRSIWFWCGVSVFSLLLGFGKHAPFYQIFYALPFASTIRNPNKFMHVFSWAFMIIFAYGIHGLYLTYMLNPVARVPGAIKQFKNWLIKASPFERGWVKGSFIAIGASLLIWLLYASFANNLQSYLQTVGIPAEQADGVARFSLGAFGWFILLLIATVALLTALFSGQFAGPRAKWGALLLGALIFLDLTRANRPWIVYMNVPYKYNSNPIIDVLRDKPYEHRVDFLGVSSQNSPPSFEFLRQIYSTYWNQQIFQYYNIQALGDVQDPRRTAEKEEFIAVLSQNLGRYWQLTNTRYLLGLGDPWVLEYVNQKFDPVLKRFKVVTRFDLVPKKPMQNPSALDLTPQPKPDGQFALYEFSGALPRAKLYSDWQINPDLTNTLQALVGPAFNPEQTVLVSNSIAAPQPTNSSLPAGDVNITSYMPKHMELDADVKTPAVLLLCDRFHPKWKVTVDGKPQTLLRCNHSERGVQLEPGKHKVVFDFTYTSTTLYFSLAGVLLGIALCGWLAFTGGGEESPDAAPSAAPKPVPDKPKGQSPRKPALQAR